MRHQRASQQDKLRRVQLMAEELRQQANVAYTEADYTKAGRLYTQVCIIIENNNDGRNESNCGHSNCNSNKN